MSALVSKPTQAPKTKIVGNLQETAVGFLDLAHPNVKLFITHGGLLSTLESTSRGVPLIGIPMYGDQHLNTKKVENAGYGLKLPYVELTETSLETAVNEMIQNPKYLKRAKELSIRFNDRPKSALDTAVYWIEYVIRHKGAPFMKSPLINISLFEYYLFEFGTIFILLVLSALSVIYIFFKILFKIFKRKSDKKSFQKNVSSGKKQR